MDLHLSRSLLSSLDTPLLVVPVPKGGSLSDAVRELDAACLGGAIQRAVDEGDLRGGEEESILFYNASGGGPRRVVALGTGSASELTAEGVRKYAGRAVRQAEKLRQTTLTLRLDPSDTVGAGAGAQAGAEGLALAAWDFRELKSPSSEGNGPAPLVTSATLHVDGEPGEVDAAVARGRAVAAGQNLARNLQSRPGNVATPTHLGEEAAAMAREWGLQVTVLGPDRLRDERMHALLAVSQGSDEEPRLIVLEHRGGREGDRPLVLVGKGLTFDAGGISIKPAGGMEAMKFDMSGGAAVIGAMRTIAELRIPLNVVGIVPSSENLLGASAMKPGDVIQTRAGKTVEVINTDAEGRLILADALDYARQFNPAAVVDCATLTGACVIALGSQAAAVLGTDEALLQELRDAGDRAGERCWPLPMFKEYRKQLESPVADLQNVGGRPAGTVTAAWFLREFAGDAPWAHLDIAGTAYGDTPLSYQRKGGFGFPVRLLVEWVRGRAG